MLLCKLCKEHFAEVEVSYGNKAIVLKYMKEGKMV